MTNEKLRADVNLDGVGEDPAVRAMLDESPKSDLEQLDIMLALRKLLTGQEMMQEEVTRLRQKMAEYDEITRRWNEEREKMYADILEESEKLKATGERRDKIIAKGVSQYQTAKQEAVANTAYNRLKFEEDLARMPKQKVFSNGVVVRTKEHGIVTMPEVVKIRHKTWVLKPGEWSEVPQVVAERVRDIRKSQTETQERSTALSSFLHNDELRKRLAEIDRKYGTNGGMPS